MTSFNLDEKYTKTEVQFIPSVDPCEDYVEILFDFSQDLEDVAVQAVGKVGEKKFFAQRQAKRSML